MRFRVASLDKTRMRGNIRMSDARDQSFSDISNSYSENSGDTFTETTTNSWFDRINAAVVGIGIGFILLAIGIGGLFWNEGRAVQTARSLAEGGSAVVSVESNRVDPSNDGKLIHVTGPVKT